MSDESSEEDVQWTEWLHSQNGVDTEGCDCSHDGMGPAWHTSNCPGALQAYASFARKAWHLAWMFGSNFLRADS